MTRKKCIPRAGREEKQTFGGTGGSFIICEITQKTQLADFSLIANTIEAAKFIEWLE